MDCVYRRREDRRGRNPLDELPSNESALCGGGGGGFVFRSLSLSRTYLAGRSHLATRVLFLLPAGIRTAFDFVDERGISDWGFWLWGMIMRCRGRYYCGWKKLYGD